jgi:cysteine-rich repeat protein
VPNDADLVGASMTFDFSAIGPVTMKQITLVDVEAEEPQAQVDLYAPGGALLATFILAQTGDNGKTIKGLGPTDNVESMVFTINGSGAIDSLIFSVAEPECGDGEINQPGETCDPPGSNAGQPNECREDCTFCGDDILDAGEECDDGNNLDGDGCSAFCEDEPFCGDGILQVELGETCEPPGSNAGQPNECRGDCTFCGDGNLDAGEECDDGNNLDGDGCSAFCAIEPFCGDGVLNLPGETCDPPGSNAGQPNECRADCTFCGDGVLDTGEQCDDGNNVDGDGCSATCEEEQEFGACTPGYWKVPQHHDSWVPTGYVTGQSVDSVFADASHFPTLADDSLLDALQYGGGPGALGGAKILLRAAVAGLLNASHPDFDYTYTEAGLIAAVNAALATEDRGTMIALAGDIDDDNNDFPCTLD